MKKILALLLTLCLLCGATALAANNQTIIKTTVEESYTITIPMTQNIAFNATETPITIEASDLRLLAAPSGKKRAVKVTVNAASGTMESVEGNTLPYTVGPEDGLLFGKDGTKAMSVNITQENWDKAEAGDYTGTLTFTIRAVDVEGSLTF